MLYMYIYIAPGSSGYRAAAQHVAWPGPDPQVVEGIPHGAQSFRIAGTVQPGATVFGKNHTLAK